MLGTMPIWVRDDLVVKTERHINRKIRTLVLTPSEYKALTPTLTTRPRLILWSRTGRVWERRKGDKNASLICQDSRALAGT
jgi:hypothetical protein